MSTFSSLLVVTFMVQKGLAESGIGSLYSYVYSREGIVPFEREVPTSACQVNPSCPKLLDKPLKGFIVNPADLPW